MKREASKAGHNPLCHLRSEPQSPHLGKGKTLAPRDGEGQTVQHMKVARKQGRDHKDQLFLWLRL